MWPGLQCALDEIHVVGWEGTGGHDTGFSGGTVRLQEQRHETPAERERPGCRKTRPRLAAGSPARTRPGARPPPWRDTS